MWSVEKNQSRSRTEIARRSARFRRTSRARRAGLRAGPGGAASFDWDTQCAYVSDLVRMSGAHLGAVIDPDGERISLIDDEAHILSNDEALFALPLLRESR